MLDRSLAQVTADGLPFFLANQSAVEAFQINPPTVYLERHGIPFHQLGMSAGNFIPFALAFLL